MYLIPSNKNASIEGLSDGRASYTFRSLHIQKWMEVEPQPKWKKYFDLCWQKAWGCLMRQTSREHLSTEGFHILLNAYRFRADWNVFVLEEDLCCWYRPFADEGVLSAAHILRGNASVLFWQNKKPLRFWSRNWWNELCMNFAKMLFWFVGNFFKQMLEKNKFLNFFRLC